MAAALFKVPEVCDRLRARGLVLPEHTHVLPAVHDTTVDEVTLLGSTLAMFLAAPMVVASWINLQYFASTVDNATFGAGTKTLQNRLGTLGVVLGDGGDLRTGLAAQSVHVPDGSRYHGPLRLQVIVEAPRERVEAVLSSQPGVSDLISNGWVRLIALDPDGDGAALLVAGEGWEELPDPSVPCPGARRCDLHGRFLGPGLNRGGVPCRWRAGAPGPGEPG